MSNLCDVCGQKVEQVEGKARRVYHAGICGYIAMKSSFSNGKFVVGENYLKILQSIIAKHEAK